MGALISEYLRCVLSLSIQKKSIFLDRRVSQTVALNQTCAESHFFKEKSSQVTQKSSHDFDFFEKTGKSQSHDFDFF